MANISRSDSAHLLATLLSRHLIAEAGVEKQRSGRRSTTIFSSEDEANSVFLVESGLIKLVSRRENGKEVLLYLVGPGEMFGEIGVLCGGVRRWSAQVVEPGILHVIPAEVFRQFCGARPEAWSLLAASLAQRVESLERKLELLSLHDVEERILITLADLARQADANESVGFAIRLSQGELASLIGATRETTSTVLNTLARRGLVLLGRRQMVVPSLSGLLAAARRESVQQASRALNVGGH